MDLLAERTLSFFVDNFPPWKILLIGCPVALLWSFMCLYFSGYLKMHRCWKTGYTRKIFHFMIFTSVVVIQSIWGTPVVCLFGGMCTLVILYAIVRGRGNPFYEAMAREKDEPHRTCYIMVPYFATLIGGLMSNILFSHAAIAGYLVTGIGDATGEIFGTRFGKHLYKVRSLSSVPAIRSWEGSLAVFVMSVGAIAASVFILPEMKLTNELFILIPLLGIVSAGVEAVSPHGWDNTTMQVIPSFLIYVIFFLPQL